MLNAKNQIRKSETDGGRESQSLPLLPGSATLRSSPCSFGISASKTLASQDSELGASKTWGILGDNTTSLPLTHPLEESDCTPPTPHPIYHHYPYSPRWCYHPKMGKGSLIDFTRFRVKG